MGRRLQAIPQGPWQVPGIRSVVTKALGSVYLLSRLLEALGIDRVVDEYAPMGRDSGKLTHGDVIRFLVMNRLSSPRPMYRVEDWARERALADLYEGFEPGWLNDDRIADAFQAIFPVLRPIYGHLVLDWLRRYGIPADEVVWDVTSVTFEGAYEDQPWITYGYNPSGRPETRQIRLGLCASVVGHIPIDYVAVAGNQPDSQTAIGNVERLKARSDGETAIQNMMRLREHWSRAELLVIGDRALLTGSNIRTLMAQGVHFVGTLVTTKEIEELALSVRPTEWQLVELEEEGSRKSQRYWVAERTAWVTLPQAKREGSFEVYGERRQALRVVLVKSWQKGLRQRKTRHQHIHKLIEKLTDLQGKLNTRRYKKRHEVEKRLETLFGEEMSRYRSMFEIEVSGEDGALELRWRINREAWRRIWKLDSIYPIGTDLPAERYDAAAIFHKYRQRPAIETRMKDLKHELRISPVFLRKREHIEGLVFVTVLALAVYSLIDWIAKRDFQVTARQLLYWFSEVGLAILFTTRGEKVVTYSNVEPRLDRIVTQVLPATTSPG